jgi:hypothetical protein
MNDSSKLNENNNLDGRIVSGTIVSIGDKDALINVNDEEEAVIPVSLFDGEALVGNKVTFKLGKKNDEVVITEIISNEKPSPDNITEGLVMSIDDGEVIVNIGYKSDVKIPESRFTDIEVGDKVKMRIDKKGDDIVVTEVLSRTKAETVIKSQETPSVENEHPTEDEPKVRKARAKVRAYNYTTDIMEVEILDGTHQELPFKLGLKLPNLKFGVDVDVRTIFNLEIVNDNGKDIVEAVQVDSNDINQGKDEEVSDSKSYDIKMQYIDTDFLLSCMSVPTHSTLEYRMVEYVVMWAIRNGIQYEFDEFGNIYLTKGELDEGEYYPCVTSHLDTVQNKHDPYIFAGVPLDLKVSKVVNQGVTEHKVSVNNEGGAEIGIGADDKGGICVCLSMFEHLDKLKACFFLDEERGCHGSDNLDEEWFKNVGYVIGFDSPDLYRAAWACDGTQLFDYDFYEKHIKEVCDSWGLTKGCFFSEPYTDVKNIREKTELICMNFGNGGYNAHNFGGTEYCIMEHMNQACGMGVELVETIGNTKHTLKHTGTYRTYGTVSSERKEDILKLEELGDNTRRGYKPTGSTSTSTSSSTSTPPTSSTSTTSKDDEIKFETVKYITERYDSLIDNIKEDVLETVKSLCESNNIDFSIFEKSISDNFSNEIKF